MATVYDQYAELARIRATTQNIQAAQFVQTALISGMAGCLNGIESELAQVRVNAHQGLAIQQELLQRDTIQSRLEEFIFQVQKLLAEVGKHDAALPASTRYFLLRGVVETVQKQGISTPIIRGRENKAAFETALQDARTLSASLENDADVKAALEWSAAEQRRQQDAILQRRQSAEAAIKPLLEKLQKLESTRVKLTFFSWYKSKFSWAKEWWHHGLLCYPGCSFVWVPIWYGLKRDSDERKANAELDRQRADIENQIRVLQQGAA